MNKHSQLILNALRIYAHHGVLPQERAVGAYFVLNLRLDVDFAAAMATDALADTVSYADVFQVVRAQMAIPSQLLEHVAGRIAHALLAAFPTVTGVHLELLKENPPMGAECGGAGVALSMERA